jgi:hypothetical protein
MRASLGTLAAQARIPIGAVLKPVETDVLSR